MPVAQSVTKVGTNRAIRAEKEAARMTNLRRARPEQEIQRAVFQHLTIRAAPAFNYPQFRMRLRGTSGDENLNRKNPL